MQKTRRSTVGFYLLATTLIPSAGAAQTPQIEAPALRLMLCSRIKDDAPRLKCFDEAIVALQQPAKQAEIGPSPTPVWEVNESKSPVDDSPQVAAGLLSVKGTAGLIFRCRERRIDGQYMPENFINSSRDGIRGLYRVNSDKPVEVRWNASTNSSTAFFNNAEAFLRLLPDDGKLFMRAYDFRGASHDATFNLGQISDIRARILAACAAAAAKAKGR